MDNFDVNELIRSVDGLKKAVENCTDIVGAKLEEIDQTLALIASRATPGEPVPVAEVMKRMADAAGGIALNYLKDWEKRSGINGG